MICAPGVKSYMAVGAYPAKEEPYSSQGTYLLFIVCAPVVNLKN